jgi:hypothetical protein
MSCGNGMALPPKSTFSRFLNRRPRSSVAGRSAATKFDHSRSVDSKNGKMLGPAGPKRCFGFIKLGVSPTAAPLMDDDSSK